MNAPKSSLGTKYTAICWVKRAILKNSSIKHHVVKLNNGCDGKQKNVKKKHKKAILSGKHTDVGKKTTFQACLSLTLMYFRLKLSVNMQTSWEF